MNDEQFTPQEQALIDRLQKAPQRRLSPGRVDAIQDRILAAMDGHTPVSRPHPFVRMLVPALTAVAAIILVILFVNRLRPQPLQTATAQALAQNGTASAAKTVTGQSRTVVVETTGAPQTETAPRPSQASRAVPVSGATATYTPLKQTYTPLSTATNEPPTRTTPTTNVTGVLPATRQSTMAASATSAPGIIIVVEGPVRDIHANIVTIYDFKIQLQPDDPMLTILNVGDMARVRGNLDKNGILLAADISNTVGTGTGTGSALVNGRVQAVNANVLTVNGIHAQLSPNDPRLKTIQVGSFVSINGDFERQGTIVVLVVVNIVIVKDVDVQAYLDCLKRKGMGMGDAMGMAAPPAMGMVDDAMGMGEPASAMGSPGCG